MPEPILEDLSFIATIDGSEERYVQILPPGFDRELTRDAMIGLHGHGSDRWQYATNPRDECRAGRDAAARHGMIFISPDYRAKTSWMGPKAEADVVQLIGELRSRHRIGRIILIGGSMGGTGALIFASRHPELLAGVVSHNGTANLVEYANFSDAIAESYGGTRAQVPEEYRARSPEFFAERFTMPIAFTTGGRDEAVPPASVLRLSEKIRKHYPHVLHIHREEGGHDTNYADCTAAIEFVIERVKSSK
jgi:pimeloyl-ACP methyl ester carboxylesterase